MEISGRSVVITGASAGIGRALAVEMAREGAFLTLAARDKHRLNETVELCLKAGAKAQAVVTDVAVEEDCKRLIHQAVSTYNKVDILINNAGISMWALFEEVRDLSIFEKMMRVNYMGAVYCTYYALPYLKESHGLLVAVSSLTGKTGVPTRSGYAATKHALQGFFDSLRIELLGTGVDVLVVSPGFVATDIRARAFSGEGIPRGESPREENSSETMSVEECVSQMMRAIRGRRRELVMTFKAKIGMWLKLIAPEVVDRMALNAVREKDH